MERALVGELRAATAATEWSTQDKCERIVRAAALVAARKEPPMTWGPLLEAILDGAGIKSQPVIQPDGAEERGYCVGDMDIAIAIVKIASRGDLAAIGEVARERH